MKAFPQNICWLFFSINTDLNSRISIFKRKKQKLAHICENTFYIQELTLYMYVSNIDQKLERPWHEANMKFNTKLIGPEALVQYNPGGSWSIWHI